MQPTINKIKQNPVMYVNILFTLLCVLFNLSSGIQFVWLSMWLLVPILLSTINAFCCVCYMSLYMRVLFDVKLFSILICVSIFIILIKELIYLNKNKLLNKYFKIIVFYLFLIAYALFYSVLVNKLLNISFIYYLNMVNLLLLFYLIKNKLDKNLILIYCYGIIVSSTLSIITYLGGLHYIPLNNPGNRFCAFMPLCNTLGVCCIVCMSLLYLMIINLKINKSFATILICILSVIGISTLSKSFFIALCILLLVIFVNQFKICKSKNQFIKFTLLGIIILSPLIVYYGNIMFKRFFINNEYSNIIDILTNGRLDKWIIYLKPYIKNLRSILFGLGLGYDYNTVYSSHSFYVGYLSKLGIFGLLSILIFIYIAIFNKNKTALKLKYLPLIIMVLICFVEDLSYNTFNFIPFILAVIPIKQDV